MQEVFPLTDADLWAMTPRNFTVKVEQAARIRRRREAALIRAAVLSQAKDPWPLIREMEGEG